jgi:hypothetical protein
MLIHTTAFTFTRLDVGRICSLYFAGLPSQHLAIGVAVMLFENVCDIEGMATVDPSYFIISGLDNAAEYT